MDFSSIIKSGLQGLQSAFQIYKNIKELLSNIQKSNGLPESGWSVYINPNERFKISWPSQRWVMREIGPVLPSLSYVNVPIQLRFKL